jgi:hypothetical protein
LTTPIEAGFTFSYLIDDVGKQLILTRCRGQSVRVSGLGCTRLREIRGFGAQRALRETGLRKQEALSAKGANDAVQGVPVQGKMLIEIVFRL